MKGLKPFLMAGLFACLLFFLPAAGWSCPVCFSAASKKVLHTYYLSAVFLSLLPFGIVAVISTYVYRQHKKQTYSSNSNEKGSEPK
ncbi:MAG: hypothetical protein ACE5HS_15800 [bacterium]